MASNSAEEPWVPMKINHTSKIGYEEVFRGLGYSEDQISRIMYALRIQHSDPIEFEEISSQIRKEREEESLAYIKAFEDAKSSASAINNDSSSEQQNGSEGERVEEQPHSVSTDIKCGRLPFDS